MSAFTVTVRTALRCTRYTAIAHTSSEASHAAAALFADIPCGITVVPF